MDDSVARLLVIDADPSGQPALRGYLTLEGFEVDWFDQERNAWQALAGGGIGSPDIIIADPFAPGFSGLSLCRKLRNYTTAPILILSWSYCERDVVAALQAGADEYLAKPVSSTELAARLRALVRRADNHRQQQNSALLQFSDLEISPAQHQVRKGGKKINLSPTEFRLLACLVQERDRVVSHRTLMTRVWGAEYVESRHYLRLYIRYLREKLEDDPADPKMILSEWGMGYRFQAPAASE